MAGYIGTGASVVSSGAERKKTYSITTTTTTLTGLVYTPTQVHVFHNGVRLVDGTDFTATDGTSITLTTAAENGDEVVVISYAAFQVADAYTKAETDSRYVNTNGDTMTGALTVNGDLTVNTDTFYVDSTNGRVNIGSTTGTTGAGSFISGAGAFYIQSGQNQTSTTKVPIVFSNIGGSSESMRIDEAGLIITPPTYNNTSGGGANVGISSSGELYRSTSSIKYKTDVKDATHGLTELMLLRPVTYKGKNDGETVFGGLIAEEVNAVGLVEFVEYADDGTPDALMYANMVSLCIKAIQEQQTKIETLEAEIDNLKARVTALETA